MSSQASEIAIYYVPLDPAGEWVMAASEWAGRPGVYRWRLVRMGFVLIDGGFKLTYGDTIQDRLALGVEEFAENRRNIEKVFHSNNLEMGVRIPPYERRGVTPFNCQSAEFRTLVLQWRARVPDHLRCKDFKVFERWTDAERAIQVSV